MNRYKRLAAGLGILSVIALTGSILSHAADNAAFLKNASLENGFLRLSVEQDARQGEYLKFRLDTTGGQVRTDKDDQKNLTYRNYYTGYTTLNINGTDYVYGRGTDTSEPAFDPEQSCHVSSQKFGDVEVQQTLTFAEGYTVGYHDMLKISYKVLSPHILLSSSAYQAWIIVFLLPLRFLPSPAQPASAPSAAVPYGIFHPVCCGFFRPAY